MITHRMRAPRPTTALEQAYERIAADLPHEYPAAALAEAQDAVAALTDPHTPGYDGIEQPREDLTALPFITIDPDGATDLDQAMHLSNSPVEGARWRVHYAIADVGRFVRPGGALDAETRERGLTEYLPDRRIPLHPPVISEGAASLLPGTVKAAYVYIVDLAESGEIVAQDLVRAVVRSVEQLDYDTVQEAHDAGRPLHPSMAALPEIGAALLAQERARGGIDLAIPDQEVTRVQEATRDDESTYTLAFRPRREIEDANAQISLLAGRVAAALMLAAGHGILRTLPRPDDATIAEFAAVVAALGFDASGTYQEILALIDHTGGDPAALAVHYASPMLFRGAGYTEITAELGEEETVQAAVGAPYAHTTAPLRRLVDRFVLPLAWAAAQGVEAPEWARTALPELPDLTNSAGSRSRKVENAVIEATEAVLLADRMGETFDGVVVSQRDATEQRAARFEVHFPEPAIVAFVDGEAEVGSRVSLVLSSVDVESGQVEFVPAER